MPVVSDIVASSNAIGARAVETGSKEFARMQAAATPFISYSINREDVLLNRLFGQRDSGFFVDVGAAHPVLDSDTKAMYDRGWTGVCIEPNVSFYRELVAQRPRDRNFNVAVSDEPGTLTFYEVVGSGLSTCDPEAVRHAADRGFEILTHQVETRSLRAILEEVAPPEIDLLKVDVEGFEFKVLLSNDWDRFRPRMVMTEATFPETPMRRPDQITPFLAAKGYRHVYFDGLNDYYAEQGFAVPAEVFDRPLNVFDNFVPYSHVLMTRSRDDLAREAEALRQEVEGRRGELAALAQALEARTGELGARKQECEALTVAAEARAQELQVLTRSFEALAQEHKGCQAIVTSLTSANSELEQSFRELDGQSALAAERRYALEIDVKRANQEVNKLRREIAGLISEGAETPPSTDYTSQLLREVEALRASTSWRITRPLRALARPRRTFNILMGRGPNGLG
jgi:FkbM family methyltransferase